MPQYQIRGINSGGYVCSWPCLSQLPTANPFCKPAIEKYIAYSRVAPNGGFRVLESSTVVQLWFLQTIPRDLVPTIPVSGSCSVPVPSSG